MPGPKRPHTYPLFIVFLPILFTFVVYVGYMQAKEQYHAAGIRNLDRQMNSILHLVTQFDQQVKAGHLTLQEAKDKVKDLLSGPRRPDGTRDVSKIDITLGPGDYLFILDSKGTAVMHPQLEGRNLYDVQNTDDRFIIREMLASPSVVIHYDWQNPGESSPRAKIALVRYFPAWDWHIGISTYEENFYSFFRNVKYLLLFLVLGSYVITVFLFLLERRRERALAESARVSEQLAQTNQSILKTLAVALEERDAYTSGHSQRVAYYMKVIAKAMGFSPEMLDVIYTGGLLHDIGKIGIEDSILQKPGKLTDEEYEMIKTHPVRGEALLRKLYAHVNHQDKQKVETILAITRSHHERIDGRGYPDQLKGDEIPLVARIAAVADSFDAMTSNRAYRKGLSFENACQEIFRNIGTQFCPQVAEAFFQSVNEDVYRRALLLTRPDDLLLESLSDSGHTDQRLPQSSTL